MGAIYEFYERRVFPHVLDFSMRALEKLRAPTLAGASGEVLEIGFGTGLNLPHYPAGIAKVVTADPMNALPERVRTRIDAAPFPVEIHHLAADRRLPFEAGRFDCVTMTWTLCTIAEPLAALGEMRRVLRPGGRLLFIEHGRSDDPRVARWQDRWNPIQNVIACGCNVNRKIDALVEQGGFRLTSLERFLAERAPRLFGEMYRGVAVSAQAAA
jgi:ubiquinone/menaquinone biosynthesis C-methylase UbiE